MGLERINADAKESTKWLKRSFGSRQDADARPVYSHRD
jgi:hypothetical protein